MKKIYLMIAAALVLCGCSESDMPQPADDNAVSFTAEYPGTSRATASAFEEGDRMGVYMTQHDGTVATPLQVSGNYANNVASTLTAGKWVNAPAVFWEDGTYNVYAYYPYRKVASVDNMEFNVLTDQSTARSGAVLGGYEASDLLWASRENIARQNSVALSFRHVLSCVVVNLVKGEDYTGELPTDAEVYIHSTCTGAYVDLATGSVEKNGRAAAETIKAKKTGDYSYAAIVVPQRLESRVPIVEVVTQGVSFLVEGRIAYRAGSQQVVNVALSDNPTSIKMEIGGEIAGWN